jgi:hypothetical protein
MRAFARTVDPFEIAVREYMGPYGSGRRGKVFPRGRYFAE